MKAEKGGDEVNFELILVYHQQKAENGYKDFWHPLMIFHKCAK